MQNLYVVKCNTPEIETDNAFYVICDQNDIDQIAFNMTDDLDDPDGSKFTANVQSYWDRHKDVSAATSYGYFCQENRCMPFILLLEEDTEFESISQVQEYFNCPAQQLLDEDRIENPENYR